MENFFYEEIHRAEFDRPYVDTEMTDIHYVAHLHEEIELVFVQEGSVELSADGKCILLNREDIAVVLPFQIHSLETPDSCRLYIIKLLCSCFDFSGMVLAHPVISPDNPAHSALREGLLRLAEESRLDDNDPVKRLAMRSAADHILLTLARLPEICPTTADRSAAHKRDMDLLNRINSFLETHFQERIGLEDAARACHLSTYYFAHSFKRATGTTFGSYLNRYRLEQARRKITEENLPITQAALECGFPTVRTFNRAFMAYYRLTPSQARKEWRG